MPLLQPTLELELTRLFTGLATNTDAQDAQQKFIHGLATAITNYVKTGTVLTVSPQGPLTGTIT